MIRVTGLVLPLEYSEDDLLGAVALRLGVATGDLSSIRLFKRSHDARQRPVRWAVTVDVDVDDPAALLARRESDPTVRPTPDLGYRPPVEAPPATEAQPRPVVVGFGPCGIFAALVLAEAGLRPLVLERGKAVRERTKDTFAFWRQGELDPESNVQFGEGGAGTFSDGKLYSQVRDRRHLGRKVLTEFVEAGAPESILTDGRPHIGTFRLVKMVESLRAKIERLGGEIRFRSRVVDLVVEDGRMRGVVLEDGAEIRTDEVVLAVGHSARDVFGLLDRRGVRIEAKPFSIGVRVEHPQDLVDRARFGEQAGHPLLGAADYRLSHHCRGAGLEGRTVYSFCMCPGGRVVAASSELGGVVTNGMSQYDRAERNANSGIVVDLEPERDFPGGPLAGVDLQRHWESRAFVAAGETYDAPAQLLGDLLARRRSTDLGSVVPSYEPGVTPVDLRECLPELVVDAIREAIPAFDRKLPGFSRDEAVFTGVETRTSSPVRVPRGPDGQSVSTPGLFPAGEGAGFAGGILSAGIDGIRAAEAVVRSRDGALRSG